MQRACRRRTLGRNQGGKGVRHANRNRGWAKFWAVLTVAAVLAACVRTPPEERLRTTIAGLQAAIEQHDGSTVEDVLAHDFIGPGGLDREGARRLAQGAFLRYPRVGVNLGPLEIDLHAAHATVRFTAALTGGAGMLPD